MTDKNTEKKMIRIMDGCSFDFKYQGHDICLTCFPVSGKEKLVVDGELVCEKRSFGRSSEIRFDVQGGEYKLTLNMQSLTKGPIICSLVVDNTVVAQKHLVFTGVETTRERRSPILRLLVWVVIGVAFAMVKDYFDWPLWSLFIFIALVVVALFGVMLLKGRGQEAYIKDIDVN